MPENTQFTDYFSKIVKNVLDLTATETQTINEPGDFEEQIFTLEEIKGKLTEYYNNGIPRGVHPGWDSLAPYYRPRKGEVTIVTGCPGHGKTTFIDAMLIKLAIREKWKFGIFSAENHPIERHAAGLITKYAGFPFFDGPTNRITPLDLNLAIANLKNHFYLINPKEENRNVNYLIAIAKYLVETHQIDGFVLDPWNELDHSRPQWMSETEYVSVALSKIRYFAREYKIHFWLLAHPQKLYRREDGSYPIPVLYDISGSAHFRNKADMGLCVYRNEQSNKNISEIHIQKVRFQENGKLGVVKLLFDRITGRFSELPENQKLFME